MVLVDADVNNGEMQDFLYRDRTKLSVYAKGIFGLALAKVKANERLAMIVQNIDQFLVQDNENQTAYLKLPEGSFWWFWYDSETEANAYYLKLLARTDRKGEKASRLAKYLLNNRKHATYWNSTRDTAIAIEALAEFWKASGEDRPEMTVEVSVDGRKVKEVSITAADLFTYDDRVAVAGDALSTGSHKIELRKRGKGPLYFNAYLTTFTLEDFITRAGLEIKVDRAYYKLTRADESANAAGSRGQVVAERREKYRRELLPERQRGQKRRLARDRADRRQQERLRAHRAGRPKSGRCRAIRRPKRLQCPRAGGLCRAARRKGEPFPPRAAPRPAQPAIPHAGRNPRQVQRLAGNRLGHVRSRAQGQLG